MRLARVITVALSLGGASAALAEDVTLALPAGASPVELYAAPGVDDVKVSGALLVGVRLAGGTGMFDIERLRIARPLGIGSVCLQIATIDGRYWSLNALVATAEPGEIGRVRLGSRYAAALGRYRASDVAVRATTAASCTELAQGDVLPVVDAAPRGPVELLVNAGSSSAALRTGEAQWSPCRRISDRSAVAYNAVCTVDAASAARAIDVEIATIGLTGKRAASTRYTVRLPAP